MPPKKVPAGERKAVEKKKEKVAEDKTFGLKNKNKSKSVQKYIASVKQTVRLAPGERPVSEHEIRAEKKKEQERASMLNSLFGPLGLLEVKKKKKKPEDDKGKIDLYQDQRDQADNKEADDMANWDQAKLETVVGQRHGAQAKQCQTDIICKFFLDAVEKSLYGWFWVCPNGGDTCKYRHSLPPGYVLKKAVAVADEDEEEEQMSIEDQIEMERAALPSGGVQVTEETFKQWLINRAEQKRAAEEKEKQAIIDAASKRGGQRGVGLSGRDLFAYDPSLFIDDDAAAGQDVYAEMTEDPDLYDDDVELDDISEGEDEGDEDEAEDDDEEENDEDESMEPEVHAPTVVTG